MIPFDDKLVNRILSENLDGNVDKAAVELTLRQQLSLLGSSNPDIIWAEHPVHAFQLWADILSKKRDVTRFMTSKPYPRSTKFPISRHLSLSQKYADSWKKVRRGRKRSVDPGRERLFHETDRALRLSLSSELREWNQLVIESGEGLTRNWNFNYSSRNFSTWGGSADIFFNTGRFFSSRPLDLFHNRRHRVERPHEHALLYSIAWATLFSPHKLQSELPVQLLPAWENGLLSFWMMNNTVIALHKPKVMRLDNMIHCESGPAVDWGTKKWYFVRGLHTPKNHHSRIARPTLDGIVKEKNQEIRRVMVEQYGFEEFIKDSKIRAVQKDEFGALYVDKSNPRRWESLTMVRVKNATPEPDGSYKDYFLRVPPTIRTAKEAVSWTFSEEPSDYSPISES